MSEVNKPESTQPESRDSLALVIGGLFILSLVFATYNYFNKTTDTTAETNTEENVSLVDKVKELVMGNDKTEEEANMEEELQLNEGDLNGSGAMDKADDTETKEGTTDSNDSTMMENTTSTWTANNYNEGEIKAGDYTVKAGDTLWEIAEAVYGNGAEWTTILNANSSSIGHLPNGQQALIMPGQVLTIPSR